MKKISLAVMLIVYVGSAYAQYDEKALVILDAMSEKYKKISAYSAKIKSSMVNDIEVGISNWYLVCKEWEFFLILLP